MSGSVLHGLGVVFLVVLAALLAWGVFCLITKLFDANERAEFAHRRIDLLNSLEKKLLEHKKELDCLKDEVMCDQDQRSDKWLDFYTDIQSLKTEQERLAQKIGKRK